MCGITGVLRWQQPTETPVLQRMTDALCHRGPDAQGFLQQGPISLGHRRLSIIDLSEAANQPLSDHTGQYTVVFNGEIYNYREVRAELLQQGSRFLTQGDTEVIVEAYKAWGVGCLQRLNGMFAFALWDARAETLFLARDRLGEKPLYFQHLQDGGIIFSSELRSLRQHPEVSSQLDPAALSHYLSLNYTLTDASILVGVDKLPAAHYLLVQRGRSNAPVRYWDLAPHFRDKRRFRSIEEAAEALRSEER